jgi:hypothetical protein
MTQLSPNTVAYDQIYTILTRFIDQHRANEFTNNKEFAAEYQSIINFLNTNLSRTFKPIRSLYKRRTTSIC